MTDCETDRAAGVGGAAGAADAVEAAKSAEGPSSVERVRAFCTQHEIDPVEVCDINDATGELTCKDGRTYCEVETNIWAALPAGGSRDACSVVYLLSNLHHGGIVLRPLYVKIDGAWLSVQTGRPAPEGLPFAAHGSRFRK